MCRPAKKSSSCIGGLMPTQISLEMLSGVLFQMDSSVHWSKQEQWFSDLLRWTRAGCCTEGGDQKYAVVGSKIEVSKSLRAGLKKWSF